MPARSLVTPTVSPVGGIEERLHGGEAVVAEFEYQDAAGIEARCRLRDQVGVEFVAFFAAEERICRFVVAHFARERGCFASADVRWIAHDQIEKG